MVLACCLTGCGKGQSYENPYRVDTVIQIPVDPTEPPTEPVSTEAPAQPEETEVEQTTPVTEPPASSGSTSAGSKSSSGKTSTKSSSSGTGKTTSSKSGSSGSTAKATQPSATESPATQPAETKPAQTQPPETEPPATEPVETQPPTEPAYDPSGYSVGSLEYAVLEQINLYRDEAGVAALSMNEGLCAVASVRAYEISVLWSHTRPDGRGYATVLSDYGYGYADAAENLIYVSGSGDAASMVAKWMSSEKNKNVLISESFAAAGIGIYRANGVTYLANLLIG